MASWLKAKLSSIQEWYSSQDTQQNITVMTSFASDAFKVVMASLLCVFVPQACTVEESNRSIFESVMGDTQLALEKTINGTQMTTHICTFHENFSNLIDYNSFVLAFNFFTLGYFIYLYTIELRREKWMIDNLDYDKEQTHNAKYVRTYKYLHVIYTMNFLFSAVLVLYYYYLDYRTATTLVTNTILCSNKIRIGRELAIQSAKKDFAYSFYNNKNISFNTIDASYITDEDKMVLETNIDNPEITTISIGGGKNYLLNKKPENIHKHIANIRKYINKF